MSRKLRIALASLALALRLLVATTSTSTGDVQVTIVNGCAEAQVCVPSADPRLVPATRPRPETSMRATEKDAGPSEG